MARGFDHVVHVVRDLEAAAEFYRRLGFTVGARNRHPWGTENRLVQFPGFFVELLTVAEPDRIPVQTLSTFSFGAFNRDFLAWIGEGFSCLVVEGQDPAAEKAALDASGFGKFELLNFSRQGKRPDGSDTEVGFSIAFARDPASLHTAFFTCKQTHPQNFWSTEMQRHANGAREVSACALVAENPSDHHVFLEALIGVRDVHASSLGLAIRTPRGVLLALDRRGFHDTYGAQAPMDVGLRIGALVFKVESLAIVEATLARSGISARLYREKLVVSGSGAFGAVLVFETS